MEENRPTAYTVYVHTYPGVEVHTTSQDGPLAVLHVDECAIMVRDLDTADKLVEAAVRVRAILAGQWPPKVGL